MTDTPFQWILVRALAEGFRARGLEVTAIEDREFAAGPAVKTPVALGGEIRNFSTEAWWTLSANISVIIRVVDPQGAVVIEKLVSTQRTAEMDARWMFSTNKSPFLERTLNEALEEFVRKVVTDPDIIARLTS